MGNINIYGIKHETCPACGKEINWRNHTDILAHYNFNMKTGKYECAPLNNMVTSAGVESVWIDEYENNNCGVSIY